VSEPQFKQGNIFSLTSTDYYLLRLTEKNLIQIKLFVYFIDRDHILMNQDITLISSLKELILWVQ